MSREPRANIEANLEHLIAERDAALARERAVGDILQVINSSGGDPQPVFVAILERAMQLCEAAFGELHVYDGQQYRPVALRGLPPAHAEFRLRNPITHGPGTLTGRIREGADVLHVLDLKAEHAYRDGDPHRRAVVDLGGARTSLTVALRKGESLLGLIMIYRQEVRPYSDQQIDLFRNFAAQAVIAMENARLITETREALEQQTATAEVLQVINSSPGNLTPVFDAMLEKALYLCDCSYGVLLTYDGQHLHAVASRGVSSAMAEFLRQPIGIPSVGISHRLLCGETAVQVRDFAEGAEGSVNPIRRALVDLGGARSGLGVALRKDSNFLGAFWFFRQEVRPYTDEQVALVQNFAAQAVIAMENARLITETREALDQQTATAEVLGVINSSPGDLTPVFDAMLEKALNLCGAAFGWLDTFDGERFQTVVLRGVPAAFAEFRTQNPPAYGPGSVPQRILAGEAFVHVMDLTQEEAYRAGEPNRRAVVELGGARSAVVVPLLKEQVLLGMICIFRQEVRPFTEKQIALLRNFAAQAVIAMENARLITETRDALEQQTATAEVLQVINSSPGDLIPVFDAMLDKALRLCDAAFDVLHEVDQETIRLTATINVPEQFEAHLQTLSVRPDPAKSFLGRCIEEKRPVNVLDNSVEQPYMDRAPLAVAAVELGGIRSMLHVPLLRESSVVGVFTIFRQEVRAFTDQQIALLENFAAQAVIAMENARLITETREALEQQTATSEVLQVINRSPGDLGPVFDAMLEKALRLCSASFGNVLTFDGERFTAVATRGNPKFDQWAKQLPPFVPEPGSTNERLIRGENVVEILDIADDIGVKPDNSIRQALIETGGFRTMASVALRKDQILLGVLHVYRQEVRSFTGKQIALLQSFAAQAVIAMENARLLEELRQRNQEIADWNRELEGRVASQVKELERAGSLKRFLPPQLAELIVSHGDEGILESHRREIVVVFCDLRGFTAFAETAEPEEVLDFLRQYHGALNPLVSQFEGTLDHFSGDGIMVFFNDPVPCPDPAERAVRMAAAMREAAAELIATWRRRGHELGFGVGIAQGYATLGQIGSADRAGYTAIGTVCNLAARLCAEAKDGQILIGGRVADAIEGKIRIEEIGNLSLKGLSRPVMAFNVVEAAATRAA